MFVLYLEIKFDSKLNDDQNIWLHFQLSNEKTLNHKIGIRNPVVGKRLIPQ